MLIEREDLVHHQLPVETGKKSIQLMQFNYYYIMLCLFLLDVAVVQDVIDAEKVVHHRQGATGMFNTPFFLYP